MQRRRIFVLATIGLLLAGAAWWAWQERPTGGAGTAGPYSVLVVAPDASTFWNGSVVLGEGANPLAALLAAAQVGGFDVDVEPGPYVVAIGPYRETSSLGWTYWIVPAGAGPDAAYCPEAAADQWRLDPGDAVQWRWAVPGGTC